MKNAHIYLFCPVRRGALNPRILAKTAHGANCKQTPSLGAAFSKATFTQPPAKSRPQSSCSISEAYHPPHRKKQTKKEKKKDKPTTTKTQRWSPLSLHWWMVTATFTQASLDVLHGAQEGVGRRKGRGSEQNEALQLAEYVYADDGGNLSPAFQWISHVFQKIWDMECQPLLLVRALW